MRPKLPPIEEVTAFELAERIESGSAGYLTVAKALKTHNPGNLLEGMILAENALLKRAIQDTRLFWKRANGKKGDEFKAEFHRIAEAEKSARTRVGTLLKMISW